VTKSTSLTPAPGPSSKRRQLKHEPLESSNSSSPYDGDNPTAMAMQDNSVLSPFAYAEMGVGYEMPGGMVADGMMPHPHQGHHQFWNGLDEL